MLAFLKRLLGLSTSPDTISERGEYDSTVKQNDFLRKLGYDGDNLSKFEATLLVTRILRPVTYAISHTFKNSWEVLNETHKESLRPLQIALANAPYIKSFPRYGPYRDWDDLNKVGDADTPLTKEQRILVTDTAADVLPPDVFLKLPSNGVKTYKDKLDARLKPKT